MHAFSPSNHFFLTEFLNSLSYTIKALQYTAFSKKELFFEKERAFSLSFSIMKRFGGEKTKKSKKRLKELAVEDNRFYMLVRRSVKKKIETKAISLYRKEGDAVYKIKEFLKEGVKAEDIELQLVNLGEEFEVETIPWSVITMKLFEHARLWNTIVDELENRLINV